MLRRQEHRRATENCIHSRGENAERLPDAGHGEIHKRPLGFTDPVSLHSQHALGPADQLLHVLEQLVSIGRGLQKPLLEFTLDDRRLLMPPATAVYHLLVGEHGFALRAPVHAAFLPVGEPTLIHLQEEPLVPAVVFRNAGSHFPPPVVAHPQALQLPAHAVDITEGKFGRVPLVLDGGVLRR